MNINKLLKLASFYFKIAATNPYAPKSEEEAKRILNISGGTRINKDLIKKKFKEAITIHHPDVGGDPEMTKKIIAARDYLLEIYSEDSGFSGLDYDIDDPEEEIMTPVNKVVINTNWGGFSLSPEAIKWLIDHGYDTYEGDSGRDIPRHNPLLVACVEELGHKANGKYASLATVELRGNVYAIHNYDGVETVLYPTDAAAREPFYENKWDDHGERPDYEYADWVHV